MTRTVKGSIKLEPGTTPTASKGVMYFDSSASKLKGSKDGSTFTDIAGGGAGISQVWSMVEEREITGSASTSEDFTSLDGDVDGAYIMELFIQNPASNTGYTLRLNSATAGGNRQFLFGNGTTLSSGRDTFLEIGTITSGQSMTSIIFFPSVKTGDGRHAIIKGTTNETTSIRISNHVHYISTPVNSTNITSIGIESNVASGIGIGSVLRLWKRKA